MSKIVIRSIQQIRVLKRIVHEVAKLINEHLHINDYEWRKLRSERRHETSDNEMPDVRNAFHAKSFQIEVVSASKIVMAFSFNSNF